MSDELIVEQSDGIVTVTINRPRSRNAISFQMYQRIPHVIAQVEADPRSKVLVIRGAGDRAFAAGADISEFQTLRADGAGAMVYNAAVAAAENAIWGLSKPTIAMVHGFCIGGGCGLALCCDIRLADTASTFGITGPLGAGLQPRVHQAPDRRRGR